MKRTIALLVMALAMLVGVPASAANYDMSSLKGESGYRISITSAITTSDFIVAPAYGFQRIGFTKASAFTATGYACENKGYVAAECTSVATLNASTENLEVKTGRPWLVFDVTAAETGANVSYLTIRGHHTSVGGSGGSGGGVTLVTESTLPVTGDSSLIYRITDATNGSDCSAGTPGTARADCRWNGSAYEPIGIAATGLTNPLAADLDANGRNITGAGVIDGTSYPDLESYDAVVDISDRTTACQNWATAVEDFMDGTWNAAAGYDAKFRLLVKGTPSNPIRIATDTYDESGTWPYDSCFMLHPQNADSDTGVWPDSNGAEALVNKAGSYGGTMEITMATGAIKVDQTSMDKNACLFDFGNGYLAGKNGNNPWGMLGGIIKVRGRTEVAVVTGNTSGYSGGGAAGEGIPENSATARLNKWSTTTFAPFCGFGASYVDMAEWSLTWRTDADDIGVWMAESWGAKGPRIDAINYGSGVGIQLYGYMNNDMEIANLRGGDFGIVLGGGDPADKSLWYSSSCASGSCTENTLRGTVIGAKLYGGVVEGQEDQLLTVIDAATSYTIGKNTHWECGAGIDCLAGGWGIRPAMCDGTGTTPGARGRPAMSTNEASDCACIDRFSNVATPQTTGSPDGLCDYNRTITRVADADADNPQAHGDWVSAALDGNPLPSTIGSPNVPNIWLGPGADDDLAIVISDASVAGIMDPASSGTDAYAPFKASSALTCGSGAGCAQIIYQVPEGVSQTHANAPADTPHVDYGGFIRVHPRGVKLTNTRLEIPGGATRPASCEGTDVWLDTDATSGSRIYACESGSWVAQGSTALPIVVPPLGVAMSGTGNYYIDLDEDNASGGSLIFRNGANSNITTLDSSGNFATTGTFSATTANFSGGTGTFGAIAGNRGALSLIGGNTAGFALNTYRLMAPLTGTTNLDLYLPTTAGSSGFAMQTDGAGQLSFADFASQAELDGKSVPTTTDNRIMRADGATGDVQDSAASIDDTGNISTPGTITSTAGTDNSSRKLVLQTNTTGLGAPGAGECALGWVGTTLNQHCNGGSLTPVGGSGGLVAGSQLDALRAKPIYYNDFLGGQSAVNMDPSGFLDFSAVASGTSFIVGDQESLNPQENHPGVIGLLAAAGANSGGAVITGFNGGSKGHLDLDGGEIAEFIFSPKEASGVVIRMGFLDTTDQNDANDGIYLEANGGLAYTCKSANGGTRTTSATVATLTADAWYRGRITVNSDKTSATCEIWNEAGSSQGSQAVTTNLPADNVNTNFGAVATHTAGSASLHLLWLDWAALEFTRSLTR